MKLNKTLLFTPALVLSLAFSPVIHANDLSSLSKPETSDLKKAKDLTQEQDKIKNLKKQAQDSVKKNRDLLKKGE